MEIRYAAPAEFAAIADLDGASFGFVYSERDVEDATLDVDLDTMLVAVDGEQIVGASCEVSFELTLPGGSVPAVGLTWVSVDVTHRRQGILRQLAEQQVRSCSAPAMILTASEGGIYGRYGFGVATQRRKTIVELGEARLLHRVADHGVRRVTTDVARELVPGLYDRWRRETPGGLDRSANRWQLQLLDREHQRGGKSALFHLVHADGYVSYRIDSDWNDGHPRHACWIVDYVVCSPEAHAGLWQVLLGMDLCATIVSHRIPLDDPLPLLLESPRAVRTTLVDDALWLRPIDVAALLSARTYALDIDVVLAVTDPLLGDGVYRLHGGPAGALCERMSGESSVADVELGIADLGSLILGGTRLSPLLRSGRVRGAAAVLSRLDRALLSDVAPHLATYF